MEDSKAKRFIIDSKLFENYENLKIGVIVCNNIDNTRKINIEDNFNKVKINTKEKFKDVELANYPVVRTWRNIYKSFGEKKSRSSVEALIRRTINGNNIPNINPLVDIYNLISLKYEIPAGGEDLNNIDSDIVLTYAEGNEEFISLGTDVIENPNIGEVIYKFDNTVMCRNFNYRESDITKLTENTKQAVLVLEDMTNSNLEDALEELSNLVKTNLGAETKIFVLDKNKQSIEI